MSDDALSEVRALIAAHRAIRARQLAVFVWVGLALGALPLYELARGGPDASRMALMFAVIPVVVIALGLVTRRNRLRDIDGAAALVDRPDAIVWVYPTDTRASVNGIPTGTHGSLRLLTSSRRLGELWGLGARRAPLYDALQRALPHASFGYSAERVAEYRRDPESLRV